MKKIVFCIIVFFLTACTPKTQWGGTDSLPNLQDLRTSFIEPKKATVSRMREIFLQETAMSIGAQSGLAERSKQINAVLHKKEPYLDSIFNFKALMVHQNILPPILEEAHDTLNLDSDNALRFSDTNYRIIRQARFVTTPPTWRDYLSLNFAFPERPDNSLIPKNRKEAKIWRIYVAKGWDEGFHQADTIYQENLSRLKHDYTGMVLYHRLLTQNMVTEPYVAKTSLGITGNGSNIKINDQVLRISELPQLQTNINQWNPVVNPNE